jgi:hypothetical protein
VKTPNSKYNSAWRIAGLIRGEIQGKFGASGCLATGSVSSEVSPIQDETGVERGVLVINFVIKWRNY